MSELLSEHMERVQGPASYWVTDVQRLETANADLLEALEVIVNIGTGLLQANDLSAHSIYEAYGGADRIAREAIRKTKGEW